MVLRLTCLRRFKSPVSLLTGKGQVGPIPRKQSRLECWRRLYAPHSHPRACTVSGNNLVRQPEIFDLKELAQYLRVSKTTIRAWIRLSEDELPTHQVSNKFLFRRDEVDAWLARHKLKPHGAVSVIVEKILGELTDGNHR